MRIVNREQFLALPPNTVFSKYEPCILGPLRIKAHSIGDNDFYYVDMADSVDCNSADDMFTVLAISQKQRTSVKMEFVSLFRDAMFDEEQLFAVWEQEDVLALIERLKMCIRAK